MKIGKRGSFFVFALFVAQMHGAEWYVSPLGNHTVGTSWSTAFTNIQAVIDASSSGDTIYLAGQTYAVAQTIQWVGKTLIIRGGYAALEDDPLPGPRDPQTTPTVISGISTFSNRVFRIQQVEEGVLDGVTIQGGSAVFQIGGGGILVDRCTNLWLENLIVSNNTAIRMESNAGGVHGGGITFSNSTAVLTNSLIRDNRVLTLFGSTVSHGYGGGLALLGGSVQVVDCVMDGNWLRTAQRAWGAGIYARLGTHQVRHTVVTRNNALSSSGWATYIRGDGLSVDAAGTVVEMVNCVLAGNKDEAVYTQNGTARLIHSTIVGHGVYGLRRDGGVLAATNCILAANSNDVVGAVSLGFCLVGNATNWAGVSNNLLGNPRFERGLYLSLASPAVDLGTNTASFWGLGDRGTGTNGVADSGAADVGYHYRGGVPQTVADGHLMWDPDHADLYVEVSGHDDNPGTEAQPFATVTKALSAAKPGTWIHIGQGVFAFPQERFPLRMDKIGIRLIGSGMDATVLRAVNSTNRALELWGNVGDAMIARLTVEGGYLTNGAAFPYQALNYENPFNRRGAGLYLLNSMLTLSEVRVTNCTIRGIMNEHLFGVGVYAHNSFGVITQCVIVANQSGNGQSNTGDGLGAGLAVWGGEWKVVDSVIIQNKGWFGNNGGNYGGGVYLNSGNSWLERCRISGNSLSGQAIALRQGGGIYLMAGNVSDCVIVSNTMTATVNINALGGGIVMVRGLIRNTLVADNFAIRDGGGIYASGGAIESVTVAGNRSQEASTVAGVFLAGVLPQVLNCVFDSNSRLWDGQDVSISETGGTVSYSCTTPGRGGTGNRGPGAQLWDHATSNYRLRPGSPAMDSALEQSWMATAVDGDGQSRIRNGAPDMGFYEAQPPNEGPLRINFIGNPREGWDALNVSFEAYVHGAQTNGLVYSWDYENDAVVDESGADKRAVSHLYTPGRYHVRLVVANDLSESEELSKGGYVFVSPSQMYVSTAGDNSDGTSWGKAFHSLQSALDMALGSNVIYLRGETFMLSTTVVWSGTAGVEVRGGYEGVGTPGLRDWQLWPTILRRNSSAGNFRILFMSYAGGLLSGLTLADGYTTELAAQPIAPGSGGGIRMEYSDLTIEHCIFTNNQGRTSGNSYMWGGGLFALSSRLDVSNCLFVGNIAYGGPVVSANNRSLGGGLAATGCALRVVASRFIRNDADAGGNHQSWGGGLYAIGGTNIIRNSLFAFNRACPNTRNSGYGGGLYINPGTWVENCTVISNQTRNPDSTASGDGIYQNGGSITNTIVYFNANLMSNTVNNIRILTSAAVGYSCASDLTEGVNGNITAEPLFENLLSGDGVLKAASPCRNAGLVLDWMTGATDLAGRPRILQGVPDMGALELPPPSGTLMIIR